MTTANAIAIPSILSANTFFWNSSSNASGRRYNEERHQSTVADFFKALGFEVTRRGDKVVAVSAEHKLEVIFEYSESCKNVYKHLSVSRNGKNSNISAIKKLVA